MSVHDDVRTAKAQLREAMFAVECWPEALAAVARACGSRSGQLIGMDRDGVVLTHVLTGVEQEEMDQIMAAAIGDPVKNPRLMIGRRAEVLVPVADQDWVDAEARGRSPMYQEVYHRLDLMFNCQTVLAREADLLLRASVTRTAAQGPLSAEDMRAFTALAPHIQSAARVQVNQARTYSSSALQMLDAMGAPGLLLDAGGGVVALSAAAESEIARGRLLRLRGRRPVTLLDDDLPAFRHAVANALTDPEAWSPADRLVSLRNRSGEADYVVEILPLASGGFLRGLSPAALILARPAKSVQTPQNLARGAWSLTEAEADITVRLAAGADLDGIAEARGVSRTTVRSQLQSIYSKAGVRRQAELVSALLALGGRPWPDPDPDSVAAAWSDS